MRQVDSNKFNEASAGVFCEVGQTLSQARKELNLTIAQVANIIHIRQKYLSDLEDGRLYDLPARVYTLGFIRTYARLLNLDGEELIRRLGVLPGPPLYDQVQMPVLPHSEEVPGYRTIIASIALALFTAVAGYFFFKPSSGEIAVPEERGNLEERENLDKALPSPLTGASPDLDKPVEMKALTVPENLPLPRGEADPSLKKPVSQQAPDRIQDESGNMPLLENTIRLEAIEPTWLEIRDGKGKVLFMKVLQRGEKFEIPNQPDIRMNVGNAGGLDIYSGKIKLAPLGERGEVKRGILLDSLKP